MKRRSLLIALLSSILAATAIAQKSPDPAAKFYSMTQAAPKAYKKGEFETARTTATALLTEAESWRENWNYGNAIHVANLVIGRVELRNGNVEKARQYLLAAGQTPGSPQLNSFGPDMLFAKEMLKAGEKESVIEYLNLCEKFWAKNNSLIATWKAQIEKGEAPDFGANLLYVFG